MSARHLYCADCRLRVLASAPEIDLLEGRCPLCEATLSGATLAAGVVGFQSFDLCVLSDRESRDLPPGRPADLAARRHAASARDGLDVDRWSDEGGSIGVEALAD